MPNEVFVTPPRGIPGIGTAAAYASGDAFGVVFALEVPLEGTIANVIFYDLDDEGLDKDIFLFSVAPVGTADNSVFAPTDNEVLTCVGVISIADWKNAGSNQVGMATPALSYYAPSGKLWGQFVTRGADNIAAANIPQFSLVII